MAFPNILTTAENSTNTAGTSHVITLPTGIVSGNGIVIILDKGSTSATFNSLAGWNELIDVNAGNGMTVWYREADGSEGATVTFTSSANTRSASIAYRIEGQQSFDVRTPEISTVNTGTSTTPEATTCTPTGGAKDYLWITFVGMAGEELDDDTWGNSPPTNYTPNPPTQKSCGTAGTNLGGLIVAASRQLNAASEDAGTFSVDSSAAWNAYTIAIHPQPQDIPSKSASYQGPMGAPQAAWFRNAPKPTPRPMTGSEYTYIPTVVTPVTLDEIAPVPTAAVVTTIALSGWVFFSPPVAAAFVNYDTPMPLVHAARPAPRPATDDAPYRYATNQQAWMGVQDGPRPRFSSVAPRPMPDAFIPPVVPAVYPSALDPMPIPKYTAPRPSIRLNQVGTVGVFFYMPYDFGWASESRPPVSKSLSRQLLADPYIPTAVAATYDYGWFAAPRLPVALKSSNARYRTPDIHILIPGTTPDYGWTSSVRPRSLPPQGPKRDIDPFIPAAVVVSTYDYGWTAITRLPVSLKPSNGRNLAPDLFWYFTGRIADWSWLLEAQKPKPPRPTVGRVLGPDPFIITPGRTPDYGWFARPQLPLHPPLPLGARAYIDWFPWQVLNFLPPLNRTSTQVLYLPYTTENVLPYSTRLNGLPYETEEG